MGAASELEGLSVVLSQNCTSYLTVLDRPTREGGRSHNIASSKLPSCHQRAVGHAQLVLEEWKLHLAAALVATSGTQWSKWDTDDDPALAGSSPCPGGPWPGTGPGQELLQRREWNPE